MTLKTMTGVNPESSLRRAVTDVYFEALSADLRNHMGQDVSSADVLMALVDMWAYWAADGKGIEGIVNPPIEVYHIAVAFLCGYANAEGVSEAQAKTIAEKIWRLAWDEAVDMFAKATRQQ